MDTFVAGFHLAALGSNSIRSWNQRFYPLFDTKESSSTLTFRQGDEQTPLIAVKDRLSKREAKLGDLFALGCVLFFLATSEMIGEYGEDTKGSAFEVFIQRRLGQLGIARQEVTDALEKNVFDTDDVKQYFPSYTDLVVKLLGFGTLNPEVVASDDVVRECLDSPLFTRVLPKIRLPPPPRAQGPVKGEPPFVGEFLRDVTLSLEGSQKTESIQLSRQVPPARGMIRIPRISRQIGPSQDQEIWDRSLTEAQTIIFRLGAVCPDRESLWTCTILAMFSFLDKSSIDTNPVLVRQYKRTHFQMEPMWVFILTLTLLSSKLLDYPLGLKDIMTKVFHVSDENFAAVQDLVVKGEEEILNRTRFQIWSPPHNKLFCQEETLGGTPTFLGAKQQSDKQLFASFIAVLKQRQIRVLIFDVNVFFPDDVDVNLLQLDEIKGNLLQGERSEFRRAFFEALRTGYPEATVYLVVRQDPLHDLVDVDQFRRTVIEQKRKDVVAEAEQPSRSWSKYLYERILQLLPSALKPKVESGESQDVNFPLINDRLNEARRTLLHLDLIPGLQLLEEVDDTEPSQQPILVKVNVRSYQDFALVYTQPQSQLLWDEFHKREISLLPDENNSVHDPLEGHPFSYTLR